MSFLERLASLRDYAPSNCLGTALFLGGFTDRDRFCDPGESGNYLASETSREKLQRGDLIAWIRPTNPELLHIAAVRNPSSLRIAHRLCFQGPIETNDPVELISNFYYPFEIWGILSQKYFKSAHKLD